jgi:hypothetical protein
MKLRFVCFLLVLVSVARAEDAVDVTRQDCVDEALCFIQVPGAICADGTKTGFSLMYRKGAKNLFIYLNGGGACWSKDTCEKGTASTLTAEVPYEGPYLGQDPNHLSGWADFNNGANPVGQGYNLARVPYCTADVHMGSQVVNYGTAAAPYVIHHVGYRNLGLILKEIQKRFPDPEQILFMGTSAGGLGITFNLHQLRQVYPKNKVFALNDGGLPFKAPYVGAKNLEHLYVSWGAHQTSPIPPAYLNGDNLATAILDFNQDNFPDIAYGFIAGYKDWTMSLFARLLGSLNFTSAVRSTMIEVADNHFSKAPNYKVFYIEDFWHGFAAKDPAKVVSKGVRLSDWVNAMISESHGWEDVRPDKP